MTELITTEPDKPEALKILLVEDNPADAMMFSLLLKKRSPESQITIVHDGVEAVDHLLGLKEPGAAVAPDVVLLDLNLPRKNGFEVLADTRADANLKNLPVLMITTSASKEDAERARALGVTSFITKASDLTSFEELINVLVDEEFPKIRSAKTLTESPDELKTVRLSSQTKVSASAFRLLVESVKDYAIFMLSPEGYILTWNEGAHRIKQYSGQEIIGTHFSVFYESEARQAGHPEFELRTAAEQGRYQEEGWRLRKDGTRFWASVTITAIRDASDALLGYSKVTRDLTDQKNAAEKLQESEERFRILVEGVRDYAIFMLDPQGHVVSWNRGAQRIKGYEGSEILGKHFSKFYTDKAIAEKHPEFELKKAAEEEVYEEEGIRVRKDGSTFWAHVVITALYDKEHRLTGYSKITRDITERKRGEQSILDINTELEKRVQERTKQLERSRAMLEQQKEELLRSNSDLQQFAYVASHDLQEPLRIVVSHLQLVDRVDRKNISPASQQSMEFAIQSAMKMRSLVSDLLAYSRIERTNETHLTDLNSTLEQLQVQLADALGRSHATLTVGHLPRLTVDPVQLTQLFQNLILNAITYRHPDRAPAISITAEEKPGEWLFTVKDNGLGIEKEYWQKIFVIFQRLHGGNDKYPGTGIGLAICKRILERHHGRIWLDSIPGEGTSFFFSLPRA